MFIQNTYCNLYIIVAYFVFMSCLICILAWQGRPTLPASLNYKFHISLCRFLLHLYSSIFTPFSFLFYRNLRRNENKGIVVFKLYSPTLRICTSDINDLFVNKSVEYNILYPTKRREGKRKKCKWRRTCVTYFLTTTSQLRVIAS